MTRAHRARRLVLPRAAVIALARAARFGPGAASPANPATADPVVRAAGMLARVGHVQIDTISVVERAHHHVFWSCDRDYRPAHLAALESAPRRAFEYWAHAAAYLPMEDYRFCLPRMRRIAGSGHEWFPTDPAIVSAVLDRIRAEGPLRSCDFTGGDGPRGPWWDWKPAKAALEYLFMSGALMVASRPGFQKLYDLAERVLPPDADLRFPTDEEMGDWYVRRAASAYGAFSEADVAYMRKDGKAGLRAAVDRAVESGSIVEVRVEGDDDRRLWADADMLGGALSGASGAFSGDAPDERPLRILSPFDNYIIDRKRALRVLGLRYTLECYVPEAKRKFGYFALPVIWKGAPAGLLDCAADRKAKVLVMKRAEFRFAQLEDEASAALEIPDLRRAETSGLAPAGFADALEDELSSFAAFNRCESVSIPRKND